MIGDLLAARTQMALSLVFHIVFAVAGVAMPVLMVMAEWRWRRTGDRLYLELTRRWAKGTAILFAVGAVSGTVLSFELGLLWPRFMQFAGGVIGMPFSLEGFAFFTEAIFLGIYLYGWDRVPARVHLASGVLVAVSGALSAVFVTTANAWMNRPAGFTMGAGRVLDVEPFRAMANPAAFGQVLHMVLASYAAVGFAVAGIHALMLLKHPGERFHRAALAIALAAGIPAAVLQPLSGDILARMVARTQPAKLAAMEGQFRTEAGAPLRIGGVPDTRLGETRWSLEIPKGLSLLAFHDPDAVVTGLDDIPRHLWPPVWIVHVSFQIMVASGSVLALAGLFIVFGFLRLRRLPASPWLLKSLVAISPLGVLAVEFGWFVTEAGRQPWIIQGIMTTAEAVTPMPGLIVPLTAISVVYLLLAVIVTLLIRHQVVEAARLPLEPEPDA